MKTCTKCRVNKAKEDGNAHQAQCKACKHAQRKECIRKRKGRLSYSYEQRKRRHFFKFKREGEMVTFERFKAIYQAQGGRCVESGAPFVFDSKDLFPSPDRIDNNGGYEDENVRFVDVSTTCVVQISKTIEEFRGSN